MSHHRDLPVSQELPPLGGSAGRIARRQTTYWEVETEQGELWRIHFRGKLEARFHQSEFSCPQLLTSHPLLSNHIEPWCDVYFNGRPTNAVLLEAAIVQVVDHVTDGWRQAREYRNQQASFDGRYGLAMRAPVAIALAVEVAMIQASLSTSIIESQASPKCPVLLLLGRSYVVAEELRFERICEAV